MSFTPRPVVLMILDGWGHRVAAPDNAITSARTPVWDRFWRDSTRTLLYASEAAVGLPSSQMGNSEVGHLNLGAGRVVYQEYTRINRAIQSGAFFNNKTLTDAVDLARTTGRALHIMGLLSPGGVHSHENHVHAALTLAAQRGLSQTYVHAFLDGRDTLPRSAQSSLERLEIHLKTLGHGQLASVVGRYYAMDRDHRWPRIQAAYDLLTLGHGAYVAESGVAALAAAYGRGESDEFVQATAITAESRSIRIEDGDVLLFMNFRSDRARQIVRPFLEDVFDGFARQARPRLGRFVSLTEYQTEFQAPVAFPPERLQNVLGAYLSALGKRQLRVAETEKYAHVTFFFNGGVERPFGGEERLLVASPTDVATYNLRPEMSAPQVADAVINAVQGGRYDVILCNFANPDMVGHTGDFAATVRAVEAIDGCLGRIAEAVRRAGGELLITADHGNAEQMRDSASGQAHTAHTINPVPLVYVGRPARIAEGGSLQDVAPTLLRLLGLPVPSEMTGQPLLSFR